MLFSLLQSRRQRRQRSTLDHGARKTLELRLDGPEGVLQTGTAVREFAGGRADA
jgi:hypothetical protein